MNERITNIGIDYVQILRDSYILDLKLPERKSSYRKEWMYASRIFKGNNSMLLIS